MIQNTEEWYKLRNTRLGASEANIVMGVSKFMTQKQLWERKIGVAQDGNTDPNFIQAKGHRMEEKIRAALELDIGYDFPPVVVLSEEYPYLMASLDGYCQELGIVLEAKYVGKDDFERVRNNEMLPQYKPQIMQQILLTGASKAILAVMMENDTSTQFTSMEVAPDIPYIRDQLLPALRNFWACVESKTEPELAKKDVLDMTDDVELSDLVTRYKLLATDLGDLEKTVESVKDAIFKKIRHNNVVCQDVKIQKIEVKGRETWDYPKFLEDNNLQIPESYLKVGKPSTTKKITLPKF